MNINQTSPNTSSDDSLLVPPLMGSLASRVTAQRRARRLGSPEGTVREDTMSDTPMFRSLALADVVDPDTYRAELIKTALVFPQIAEETDGEGSDRA